MVEVEGAGWRRKISKVRTGADKDVINGSMPCVGCWGRKVGEEHHEKRRKNKSKLSIKHNRRQSLMKARDITETA